MIPAFITDGTDWAQGRLSRMSVLLVLALLVAFGLYLRVPHDLAYGYNMDEAIHVNIASGDSLGEVLRFSRYEGHPPLLYILVHYWMKISADPAFVRCLPLLLGTLLIPVYYLIGNRIGGELCGLCGAALITLSHACIVQSYTVRQYCVLMLCLSLNFYCYLSWRESHRRSMLLWYVLLGWLAAISHFSAIIYFLCVAPFEACVMIGQRAEKRRLLQWLLANLAVAALAVFIYHLWQPLIATRKFYFLTVFPHPPTLQMLMAAMLSGPFLEGSYILPSFPILPAVLAYAVLPNLTTERRTALRLYIVLTVIACLWSMILYASWLYPSLGGRHSLWMLPFIVPVVGGMMADLLTHDKEKTPFKNKHAGIIVLLVAFAALFAGGERFNGERGEERNWSWSLYQLRSIDKILGALTSRDLVEMEKFNVGPYANPYPHMNDDDAFTGITMATEVPFHDTHIFFNPYFPHDYSTGVTLATLRDAQAKHMFDGVDRLVFVADLGRAAVIDMALCDKLKKEMTTVPPLKPFPAGHELTRKDLRGRIIVLTVPKKAIVDDVLPSTGKAHSCLDGKHDVLHGFVPPFAHK